MIQRENVSIRRSEFIWRDGLQSRVFRFPPDNLKVMAIEVKIPFEVVAELNDFMSVLTCYDRVNVQREAGPLRP